MIALNIPGVFGISAAALALLLLVKVALSPSADCTGNQNRRLEMLCSHPVLSRIALLSLTVSPLMAGKAHGADPAQDPAVTIYGTLNPAAPAELATFSFLVGKWTGTGKYRDAAGKPTDFAVLWVGRYALDGMAIADEQRTPESQGGAIVGLTLRFFDPVRKTWTVEFLNFGRLFLRKQTNASSGAVLQEGKKITISQSGPEGAPGREVYTVVDANHFTYSMDVKKDGVWDEGIVTMKLERQE
jgi:hypothetical protein